MNLLAFFRERASREQPLVLATVIETRGSTYSKAGGQMIIDSDGNFCGMLSGGCLEGDLVERARQVMRAGRADIATYDLAADDELWGLGVGCDGTMRVLLQPLTAATGYQPFAAIADVLSGHQSADLALVVSSDSTKIEAGAGVLFRNGGWQAFGVGDAMAQAIRRALGDVSSGGLRQVETAEGGCTILLTPITPPPALLLLGAGPDSEPVVRFAAELGWRCTVFDHRPAYVKIRAFPEATRVLCSPVDELKGHLRLDEFDVAIVMSHHLASDRSYLCQLATSDIGYIGLLGPIGRRRRLLDDLGELAGALEDRLHGPAGLDLGGRGPGPIALSIIAEMQQFLSQRR